MCTTDVLFMIKIISLCVLVSDSNGVQSSNFTHTRLIRQARDNRCTLPPHPVHGKWTVYEHSFSLFPGNMVPPRTVLKMDCGGPYKIDSYEFSTCIEGNWRPKIGKCLRTCPTIKSTSIMTVTCTHNGCKLDSCERPFEGTIARFQCTQFYEDQALERQPFRVCSNGNWDGSLPTCVSKCGQVSPKKDPSLIVGGTEAKRGEYPWQVALYSAQDKLLLCGGTLLNQRVIITAAHCITDNKGKLQPKELYMVAAGKYFREYDHPNDTTDAQFSSIHEMFIPRQYKAALHHYFGDIGIIVTKEIFNFSTNVVPVCIMWEPRRHQVLTDPIRTKHAYVSGWGYTSEHKEDPSDVLKHLKVPLVTDDECNMRLSEYENEEDVEYMTDDKLCAGFLNSSTSVCKGDSGGGLVIKYKNRYYIIGIVSISPNGGTENGGCNSQLYTLYTRFSYYIESFILEKEAQFRPRFDCEDGVNCNNNVSVTTPSTTTEVVTEPSISNGCTLPNHPKSGQWSILGAPNTLQPGTLVPSNTVLKIECNRNFTLDGNNVIFCNNNKWSPDIGRCLKTCPPRISTATMRVTCIHKTKETENCTEAVQGTLAKFRCALFYEDLQLKTKAVQVCIDGEWDQPTPKCVPVCGKKSVEPTPLIVNGTSVVRGDYPWQVAVYRKKDKLLICSGSLLSERIVLTGAVCITNHSTGDLLPKENYIIAVGKYYRNFNDSRDNEAQFSELEAMYVPDEYRGQIQNYLGDIAILVPKKIFTLSRRVQPVCLDAAQNYNLAPNTVGYVTGWGFTRENSAPAEVLNELKVPFVSTSECRTNLPQDFDIYFTHDKICAGYLDRGMSVCKGDTGGGLVFKHDGRYYITGIVSVAPIAPTIEGGCDSQQYGLYTKVSNYIERFILRKLSIYRR